MLHTGVTSGAVQQAFENPRQQARPRATPLVAAILGELLLHGLEQVLGDDCLVLAGVDASLILHAPQIGDVGQQVMQPRLVEGPASRSKSTEAEVESVVI